ncbi:MAG: hypothetical protein HYS13_23835 [Planctomycetia bacterium]|nr:hypothetical protein [Planctomycetia bacterium]
MRMGQGNLIANSAALRKALVALRQRWDETKTHWHDTASQNFQEEHLAELEKHCQAAAEQIEQIAHVLGKICADCSPERQTI